jgi:hypothetical protein
VSTIPVAANDSVYIYVTVSINPTSANLPFVVRDSLEINYNGNRQFVQLEAYGKNAHFFRNRKLKLSETWNNDLPYVILDGIVVDTNAVLTINKGCRIYSHADAPFIVNGTLKVNGEKWDSTRVVFTGDRLDAPYSDFPGSYPGILFTSVSTNNVLNYAVIKNAYQGIVLTDPSVTTKLTLNETIIDNAYDAGLLAVNSSVAARNLLVSNCGKNIQLAGGGNYSFLHCTSVNYSNIYNQHRNENLLLTNYIVQNNLPVVNNLTADFRNCIFWGEDNGYVTNEVVVSKQGQGNFSVLFDQVMWRLQTPPANTTINGAINTNAPLFDSVNNAQRIYSFRLQETSPARNKGLASALTLDLDGNPRPVGLPDLGAYERQ